MDWIIYLAAAFGAICNPITLYLLMRRDIRN